MMRAGFQAVGFLSLRPAGASRGAPTRDPILPYSLIPIPYSLPSHSIESI